VICAQSFHIAPLGAIIFTNLYTPHATLNYSMYGAVLKERARLRDSSDSMKKFDWYKNLGDKDVMRNKRNPNMESEVLLGRHDYIQLQTVLNAYGDFNRGHIVSEDRAIWIYLGKPRC